MVKRDEPVEGFLRVARDSTTAIRSAETVYRLENGRNSGRGAHFRSTRRFDANAVIDRGPDPTYFRVGLSG
jgi:hypothetical protein